MALTIELQNAQRELLERLDQYQWEPILPDLEDPNYPMLGLIDRYGDTYFNSVQMTRIQEELQQRMSEIGESPQLLNLMNLAKVCAEGIQTYLVFIGD